MGSRGNRARVSPWEGESQDWGIHPTYCSVPHLWSSWDHSSLRSGETGDALLSHLLQAQRQAQEGRKGQEGQT